MAPEDSAAIAKALLFLYTDRQRATRMAQAVSPYGDGHAAERIVKIILEQILAQ